MNNDEIVKYLKSLEIGDEVVETGNNCMNGLKGEVCIGTINKSSKCVKWKLEDGIFMKTSLTYGTRRIKDV